MVARDEREPGKSGGRLSDLVPHFNKSLSNGRFTATSLDEWIPMRTHFQGEHVDGR
jgi:hypothetical protein